MRSTLISFAAVAGIASAQLVENGNATTCIVPTLTMGGDVATITQTFTSTYCPACPNVVTTYTTVYQQFCPTGLQDQVYTVSETCAPDSCRTGIAPGFVTNVATCNVCGPTPITATLTQPCTDCPQATQVQNYPTVYQTLGPSGLTDATYTVTASCAATPCPSPVENAPAPGFTTTVETCTTCGATPVTATLTVPQVANAGATGAAAGPGADTGAGAGAGSDNGVSPAAYTGAASSNNAGYFVAGLAGVAAVAQLL